MRTLELEVHDTETGERRVHSFSRSPVTIGRSPRNDLALGFGFVSGSHAKIEFDAGGGTFCDLGSTNGTSVDGRRVEAGRPVVIGDGLRVLIGKLELFLRWDAKIDRATSSPGFDRATSSPGFDRAHSGAMAEPTPAPGREPGGVSATTPSTRSIRSATLPVPVAAEGRGPAETASAASASAAPDQDSASEAATPPEPSPEPTPTLAPTPSESRPFGAEATGFVDLGGVHRVIRELRPAYDQLEAAREHMAGQLEQALSTLPSSSRPTAMAFLRREFPELPGVTPFASPSAAEPERSDAGTPDSASREQAAITSLARSLLIDAEAPTSAADQAAFLARVREVLQTAAQAFVEIRAVQARFGDEMGVRTIREYTPLHSAGDARGVLDYLLDWRRSGPERSAQLAAVYSDFMLHQVALINGVVEGVEAVLEQLEPGEIERGVSGLNRGAAAWKKYAERYAEIVEERGIAALVFGPEFARAYARVGQVPPQTA